MKQLTWLLFFSALCSTLRAATPLNADNVKKTIVFIYAAKSGGGADERRPIGTGFFVAVRKKADPTRAILLLVTARHVLDPEWMFCSAPQPDLVYIRVNKKKYDPSKDSTGVAYVPVTLVEQGEKKYFVSEDNRVDAAVVDIRWDNRSQSDYDFQPMEPIVFASPEETKKLGIGDSVASAGLIPGRSGEKRNYPFFKFGNISSIPDEGVWVTCERGMPELRLERVWFIAANLVSGNSGSPVFYLPLGTSGVTIGGNVNRVVLIGVQSSTFDGADVAGMTPVEDVFQIIKKHVGADMDLYRGSPSQKPKE